MSGYGLGLFPQHAAMLAASGVTSEQAHARGYRSVDTKARLERVGVSSAGRRVPGLLVPQLRADGSCWGYQYRPDSPRERDGKPVKYETPTGQRNGLDVPPGVGPLLADPAVPLWITEGVKKADAATVAGLACVALPGVWSWRGQNGQGGKTAIPDWHDVALDGRRVILAFDGDVARKRAVRSALTELAGYLRSKGALVEFCHLPDADDKVGLDDYLVAGHTAADLLALVHPEPPPMSDVTLTKVTTNARVTSDMPLTCDVSDVTLVTLPSEGAGIDGAALLTDIETFLSRFVVYPSDEARLAHVLWIAHTWFMDEWDSTPRIAFLSPEPGSGKSRALEVTEPLVPRPVHAVNTTPAYLFRKVSDDAGPPTILYDEIDTVFGPKAKDNEDVRGMLNAGHRKGATAGRCVIKGRNIETEELPAYCAVALAGLDDLPDTIMTRSVVVRMRRRAPGERVEPWRLRINGAEAQGLHQRLQTWSQDAGHALRWPDMPEGIEDRNADVWEALLAVADLAGGDWPERARCNAVTLVTASSGHGGSLGVILLRDLHGIFGRAGTDKIPTDQLLDALHEIDESPWADIRGKALDSRGLARRLAKYDVKPKLVRTPDGVSRGYTIEDLADPWSRYVTAETDAYAKQEEEVREGAPAAPPSPERCVTSVTALHTDEEGRAFRLSSATSETPETACSRHPVTPRPDFCSECAGIAAAS